MNFKQTINLTQDVLNFGLRSLKSKLKMNVTTKQQFDLYIGGKTVPASDGRYFDCINPSTGESFARVADANGADIEKAIVSARTQFESGIWSNMSVVERGIYLKKIAGLIRKYAKELSDLESINCGKTLKQSTFIDVPTAADCFDYFSNIDKELKDRENKTEALVKSLTAFEPMGVVACIIPFNYPLIMAAWKMAPALAAGNTIVFKPSSLAAGSIMRLAEIIKEAGLPEGVVNIIVTTDHSAGRILFEHKDIAMVSFTGGTETGREVMKSASATTKKLSLELGGKSPSIVFADCNIDAALGGAMSAIFMNQGQMCTAGSRLLVEDKIYDEFVNKLVEKTKAVTIGNALDYQANFGPVISLKARDKMLGFVERAVKAGATLLCGGKVPDGEEYKNGYFIEPTILADVDPNAEIVQDEIFGPVLVVMKFSSADEALQLANNTKYGLAACIWTKDLTKAEGMARQLEAGTIWINTYGGFYHEASFGGYKQSGHGRELGIEGLLEFTQSKNICIDQTPTGKPLVSNWF